MTLRDMAKLYTLIVQASLDQRKVLRAFSDLFAFWFRLGLHDGPAEFLLDGCLASWKQC